MDLSKIVSYCANENLVSLEDNVNKVMAQKSIDTINSIRSQAAESLMKDFGTFDIPTKKPFQK